MEGTTFNQYKVLCLKNKKMLQAVTEQIATHSDFHSHDIYNYAQIKQQYEIILAASKDSIDYNSQLQMELELKEEQLRSLKLKLQRQNRELEGLTNEVSRVSGNLRRDKKSFRELLNAEEDLQRIKIEVERLKKKKEELIRQQASFQEKQQEVKTLIRKIDEEMVEMETRNLRQSSTVARRIEQLEQEIRLKKQEVRVAKESSERPKTPSKMPDKRKSFEDLQLRIRQQKEKQII